ncbi:MAG: VPLPA-CTERM-specific exosortase XrtD [Sulfuricaulis sp.]|uniref:VPLPA-CTERM-specific exosortase XrtD n=1 Tax=Sulfuricaulis sp. TaxID=2003553 RepID=UPI0025D7B3D8|nr:VPLPA-CTERM-specific exosortase XrtD [Sulfuricaulis sp.]MCR4347303.1 VPLPA-CTERM-specific exosortase XrtD [Sulfuricaulis sp.]
MTSTVGEKLTVWKETPWIWGSFIFMAALLGFVYFDGLKDLVRMWNTKEEYSYGYLIPVITLFLIWQRKDSLERIPFSGSWAGAFITLLGIGLFVIGNLSTIYLVIQYSFLTVIAGLVLAFTGWRGFRLVRVPLLFLLFMIPLPPFLLTELSAQLQLISSEIGVWVIRLFGISVFLEGNVIDLGIYKLQVVEACSGLRYLFPLMTLGFISAYFFKAAFWKRAVLFLSTIPITVLMNSFRIGVIGVLVEYWGPKMAEGFLHDFEGWVVFMACTAVLVVEMWVLIRIGKDHRPLQEVFGLEFPAPTPKDAQAQYRPIPKPYVGAALLMVVAAITSVAMPQRVEISPPRQDFSHFPMKLEGWQGKSERMEQIYIDALKFDDYILADFANNDRQLVNFYVAYYASQQKGESAHSPRTCIPGGGWRIMSLTPHLVDGVKFGDAPLRVNRLVIQKGEHKQLVYYWFQQRGRVITNEYMVKWYLFWDALTRNRTDGALVRLTTIIPPDGDVVAADKQLAEFSGEVVGRLKEYIPD